jgi:hypothetical protein
LQERSAQNYVLSLFETITSAGFLKTSLDGIQRATEHVKKKVDRAGFEQYSSLSIAVAPPLGIELSLRRAGCGRGFKSNHPVHFFQYG